MTEACSHEFVPLGAGYDGEVVEGCRYCIHCGDDEVPASLPAMDDDPIWDKVCNECMNRKRECRCREYARETYQQEMRGYY